MVRYTARKQYEYDQGEGSKAGSQKGGKTVSVSKSSSGKSASAFRTISEVAEELDVQQHVLRFWETKFSHVKPLKRGGGRRYYRPEDIEVLKTIHDLLYNKGYTIKGVQKLFKEQGKAALVNGDIAVVNTGEASNQDSADENQPAAGLSPKQRAVLESIASDLKDMRRLLKKS